MNIATLLAGLVLLALAACDGALDGPGGVPGQPAWQNAPSHTTFESPSSRPPGS